MIFFEHSERAADLLERNLPVRNMDAKNLFSEAVVVDGFTLPKASAEAGLEIADLIIHTAGKQQRRHGRGYVDGNRNFTLDFQAVFHEVHPSWIIYQSVTSMEAENESAVVVDHWPER